MPKPDAPEQTAVPGTDGEPTPTGADGFVKADDKLWFENLLEEAKGRALTPEENEKLANKFKGYDKAISRQRTDLDRQKAELATQKQEVMQAIQELKEAKTPAQVNAALRGTSGEIRDLIEDAIEKSDDPNARETLRWLDKALKQRFAKLDKFEKDMTELRQSIDGVQKSSQQSRYQALQVEIRDLEKRYGEPIVEKYRDALIQYGTQYPNYSAKKLLHMVSDEDELDQAIEIQARKKVAPAANGARPSSPTSTARGNPADDYRGKTPAEIQRGFNKAFDKAFENVAGKMPGL